MCGLTVSHIRSLCENPWEGGGGYSPRDVADWSLDQIFMRLVDKKNLTSRRTRSVSRDQVPTLLDNDGLIKGKDAEGNPIRLPYSGKSVARRLIEAEEAKRKQAAEKSKRERRRRRGRN